MSGNITNQQRNWYGLDQLSALYVVHYYLIFKVTVPRLPGLEINPMSFTVFWIGKNDCKIQPHQWAQALHRVYNRAGILKGMPTSLCLLVHIGSWKKRIYPLFFGNLSWKEVWETQNKQQSKDQMLRRDYSLRYLSSLSQVHGPWLFLHTTARLQGFPDCKNGQTRRSRGNQGIRTRWCWPPWRDTAATWSWPSVIHKEPRAQSHFWYRITLPTTSQHGFIPWMVSVPAAPICCHRS